MLLLQLYIVVKGHATDKLAGHMPAFILLTLVDDTASVVRTIVLSVKI